MDATIDAKTLLNALLFVIILLLEKSKPMLCSLFDTLLFVIVLLLEEYR